MKPLLACVFLAVMAATGSASQLTITGLHKQLPAQMGAGNITALAARFKRSQAHIFVAQPQKSPLIVPQLAQRPIAQSIDSPTPRPNKESFQLSEQAFDSPFLSKPNWQVPTVKWPDFPKPQFGSFSQPKAGQVSSDTSNTQDSSSQPADTSACSQSDASPEAVFKCVNAVRANPKAFTDGYRARDPKCNVDSWIDAASRKSRPALTIDSRLTKSATGHATWMASVSTMSHTGKDGSSVAERIRNAGYSTYPQAENVAAGQRSAYEVAMDWMCSQGHRETLLSCDYDNVGTGLAADQNGRLYYAQNFGCHQTNSCSC